jgi:GMP synthase (glutamine-hydrolysing)
MSQIVVLNAGGQYCHLIARRVRELGVHCVVLDAETSAQSLRDANGLIISGGPRSVNESDSPRVDGGIYGLGKPILGICYGHQLIANDLGGAVLSGISKEYGMASLEISAETGLLASLPGRRFTVWMSHGDTVIAPPKGFDIVAHTPDCKVAAMEDPGRRIVGVQFHPEVSHTTYGREILERFVFGMASCHTDWDPRGQVDELIEKIRQRAAGKRVFFLVSGGIDSTVAFHLCVRALGPARVKGLYVDTGFMRQGEAEEVRRAVSGLPEGTLYVTDRRKEFFEALVGVINPEEKRKRIGELFVQMQEEEFRKLALDGETWLLGQGTIYPDTIESGGSKHSAKIKTHHNRVEGILQLIADGRIIEPLTDFYKDEVRLIAEQLGLADEIVHKHPFPGPGLAVRCICSSGGAVVRPIDRLATRKYGDGLRAWIIPLQTVGVQGDERSYSELAAIANYRDLARAGRASALITNEVRSINRVVAVLTPTGTSGLDGFLTHRGELTMARVALLRRADAIVTRVLKGSGWYQKIWQCPVALLPLGKTETGESVVLRPVYSRDGMTASFVELPSEVTSELVSQLIAVPGVDSVLYDVTNKPPATIELE